MKPFIQVNQLNFVEKQSKTILHAKLTSIDQNVIDAIVQVAWENVLRQFSVIDDEQIDQLKPMLSIRSSVDLEIFLKRLKELIIPFPEISNKQIQRLFPKEKKLNLPDLKTVDLKKTIYLRWLDKRSNKTFIITEIDKKLIGIQGDVQIHSTKGICSICKCISDVQLFTVSKKGKMQGTYTTKGNHICKDSYTCNENITNLEYLINFIDLIQ